MRCSSCEALLGAYAERALPPRAVHRVSHHLRTCPACTRLYEELRVVDALLATAKPVALPPNFTFAAMAHVRDTPVRRRRGSPIWIALAFYVVCAWIGTSAALVFEHGDRLSIGAVAAQMTGVHAWRALTGVLHSLVSVTPLVGIAVVLLLTIDLALVAGVFLFYRTVRPRLAARLRATEP